MDYELLRQLIIFVGVACIVWWAMKEMGAPRPIWIIAIVVLSIMAIDLLLSVGGHVGLLNHR